MNKLYDMHVHLRQGDMLRAVAPCTARSCVAALVMPNTYPPICDGEDVERYRREILDATAGYDFTPLMTIKLLPTTTVEDMTSAKRAGAVAVKLYVAGTTTNSDDGLPWEWVQRPPDSLKEVYRAIEGEGLVLCVHGERPDSFCLEREEDFVDGGFMWNTLDRYAQLKMVMEHVTDACTVGVIQSMSQEHPGRIAATITLHHLYLTLDDVVGGFLRPHNFCKPVAKRPEDRDALRRAALSGLPCFFLGSDSAPHAASKKESACGCAGCFTAPMLASGIRDFFQEQGRPELLNDFASGHGPRFYGIEPQVVPLDNPVIWSRP